MKPFIFLVIMMVAFGFAAISVSQENDKTVTYQQYLDLLKRIERLEGRSFTRHGTDGRPVNQGQDQKGYHKSVGEVTLSSGRAVVSLNNLPGEGKQSVSFISSETYHGKAWSLDTTNGKRYAVYPISDKQVMIKCLTDTLDSSTVKYQVEGE